MQASNKGWKADKQDRVKSRKCDESTPDIGGSIFNLLSSRVEALGEASSRHASKKLKVKSEEFLSPLSASMGREEYRQKLQQVQLYRKEFTSSRSCVFGPRVKRSITAVLNEADGFALIAIS
jgi:hypothetical protein